MPRLQGVVVHAGQGRFLSHSLFSRLIPAYRAWWYTRGEEDFYRTPYLVA